MAFVLDGSHRHELVPFKVIGDPWAATGRIKPFHGYTSILVTRAEFPVADGFHFRRIY